MRITDVPGYDPEGKNHRDLLPFLVLKHGWKKGAELGVARGILMDRLLSDCPDLHMIGVDLFRKPHNRGQVANIAARFSGRCMIYGMSTTKAARFVPDHSLDFVFIDAGHGYEAVTADIRDWAPKVRPSGCLIGHDYDPARNPGVVRAVDEAFRDRVVLWPHTVWVAA